MIPQMAREALERACALAPQKAMVAVPYAQALMMTGGGSPCGSTVAGGRAEDPANIEARSVHAFMALQRGISRPPSTAGRDVAAAGAGLGPPPMVERSMEPRQAAAASVASP